MHLKGINESDYNILQADKDFIKAKYGIFEGSVFGHLERPVWALT